MDEIIAVEPPQDIESRLLTNLKQLIASVDSQLYKSDRKIHLHPEERTILLSLRTVQTKLKDIQSDVQDFALAVEYNDEKASNSDDVNALRQQNEQLQTQLLNLQNENLKQKLHSKESKQLTAQLLAYKSKITELETQLSELNGQQQKLIAEYDGIQKQLEFELSEYQSQTANLQTQLLHLNEQNQKLTAEHVDVQNQSKLKLNEYESKMVELQTQLFNLSEKNQKLTAEHTDAQKQLEAQLFEIQKQKEELHNELIELQHENEQLKVTSLNKETTLQQLQTQLREAQQNISVENETHIEELQTLLGQTQEKLIQQTEEKSNLLSQFEALQSKYREIKSLQLKNEEEEAQNEGEQLQSNNVESELLKEKHDAEQRLKQAVQENDELKERIETLKLELETERERTIDSNQEEYDRTALSREIDTLKDTVDLQASQKCELERELNKKTKELLHLEKELDALKQDVSSDEINTLRVENETLIEVNAITEQKLTELGEQYASLQQVYSEAKTEFDALTAEQNQLCDELKDSVSRLEQENSVLQMENGQLLEKKSEAELRCIELQGSAQEAEDAQNIRKDNLSLKKQIEQLQTQVCELEQQCQQLQDEEDRSKQHYQQLEVMSEKFTQIERTAEESSKLVTEKDELLIEARKKLGETCLSLKQKEKQMEDLERKLRTLHGKLRLERQVNSKHDSTFEAHEIKMKELEDKNRELKEQHHAVVQKLKTVHSDNKNYKKLLAQMKENLKVERQTSEQAQQTSEADKQELAEKLRSLTTESNKLKETVLTLSASNSRDDESLYLYKLLCDLEADFLVIKPARACPTLFIPNLSNLGQLKVKDLSYHLQLLQALSVNILFRSGNKIQNEDRHYMLLCKPPKNKSNVIYYSHSKIMLFSYVLSVEPLLQRLTELAIHLNKQQLQLLCNRVNALFGCMMEKLLKCADHTLYLTAAADSAISFDSNNVFVFLNNLQWEQLLSGVQPAAAMDVIRERLSTAAPNWFSESMRSIAASLLQQVSVTSDYPQLLSVSEGSVGSTEELDQTSVAQQTEEIMHQLNLASHSGSQVSWDTCVTRLQQLYRSHGSLYLDIEAAFGIAQRANSKSFNASSFTSLIKQIQLQNT